MDDGLTFYVDLGSGDDALRWADEVRRAAELSCLGGEASAERAYEDAQAFVMITTEKRGDAVVQRVEFDVAEAAGRFRDLCSEGGIPAGLAASVKRLDDGF